MPTKKLLDYTVRTQPKFYSIEKPTVIDSNLSRICTKMDTLTLGINGFIEIGVYLNELDNAHKYLARPIERIDINKRQIYSKIFNTVREYFLDTWDSNRYHVIFAGAGADSRIMLWILKDLYRKQGKDWFGDFKIITHESGSNINNVKPESELFTDIMKAQGWNKENYAIHKLERAEYPDYFDLGNPHYNPNFFYFSPTVFWNNDIIPGEEKNIDLVTGYMGDGLVGHPITDSTIYTSYEYFKALLTKAIPRFANTSIVWHDVLFPFMSYKYLEFAFTLPVFALTYNPELHKDIRHDMINEYFKDNLPFYRGHNYNFALSEQRMRLMKKFYTNSKFYKNYAPLSSKVRDARPWILPEYKKIYTAIDGKLYGYAVMYERIQNEPKAAVDFRMV